MTSDHKSSATTKRLLAILAAVAVLAILVVFFTIYLTAGNSPEQRPQEPQPGTITSSSTT